MSHSPIHIGFVCNENYAKYLAVAITSIICNLPKQKDVRFHVISSDVTEESKRRLRALRRIRDFELEFLAPADGADFPENENAHVTRETNFRLQIPSLKPELKKILFLDIDLAATSDISPLWEMDLRGNCLACAPDAPNYKHHNDDFMQKTNLNNYFNTGVCLMDLEACRRHGLEERIKNALVQYGEELRFPDQDLLNIGAAGKILQIPDEWNLFVYALDFFYPQAQAARLRKKHFILHWAGAQKPWQTPSIEFADVFWDYARQTPFLADIIFANALHSPSASDKQAAKGLSYFSKLLKYCRLKCAATVTRGKRKTHYLKKKESLHEEIRALRKHR